MAITTSQQLNRYYELFKQVDISFTKNLIEVLGLMPRHIFLKCRGDSFPCVIYSASMVGAKVIANLNKSHFEIFKKANNMISLRFAFKMQDKAEPISFFVPAKITGFNPYNKDNPDTYFASLTYTQKPPDDLIEIFGEMLEANVNAKRRKEERIIITPDVIREMALDVKDIQVLIDSVPRKCILRDLSFSGAKILIVGVAKFLINKSAILKLSFRNQEDLFNIPGETLRFEAVEGRKDIAAIAMQFEESKVPLGYKMVINNFFKSRHAKKSSNK